MIKHRVCFFVVPGELTKLTLFDFFYDFFYMISFPFLEDLPNFFCFLSSFSAANEKSRKNNRNQRWLWTITTSNFPPGKKRDDKYLGRCLLQSRGVYSKLHPDGDGSRSQLETLSLVKRRLRLVLHHGTCLASVSRVRFRVT